MTRCLAITEMRKSSVPAQRLATLRALLAPSRREASHIPISEREEFHSEFIFGRLQFACNLLI
jgi:hypothetical protein